jgi:hypothetical protein
MSRSGEFAIKSTLTSQEKRTKQHETIRLHLSKRLLATQDNRSMDFCRCRSDNVPAYL